MANPGGAVDRVPVTRRSSSGPIQARSGECRLQSALLLGALLLASSRLTLAVAESAKHWKPFGYPGNMNLGADYAQNSESGVQRVSLYPVATTHRTSRSLQEASRASSEQPSRGRESAGYQGSYFETHMQGVLRTSDHGELHEGIRRAAARAQADAEAVAASGEGKSEYLEWRLGRSSTGAAEEGLEDKRRKLAVESGVSTSPALQPPGLNSLPGPADMNITAARFASVFAPGLVDWRAAPSLNTPVLDQRGCESCWLVSISDVISMHWALNMRFLEPLPLSPQYACDCGFRFCCNGGWPEWTLFFALFNRGLPTLQAYPYTARDAERCNRVNSSSLHGPITGWEKVPSRNIEILKKSVASSPMVVLIHASSRSFLAYRSGIWTGVDCPKKLSVDHALVLMGYNLSAPVPYWIAKNSWGTGWGEGGYIRIRMAGNVCGFASEPSFYPTLFKVRTPCDASPPPCGNGTCWLMADGTTARCSCPAGFVERLEDSGPKCVSAYPCNTSPSNPCGFGDCGNAFDGSYTCSCPAGTVVGARADGAETCIVNSFQSGLETFSALPGDNCTTLQETFGISQAALLAMNPFLDCASSMVPGTIIILGTPDSGGLRGSFNVSCGATYAVGPGEACATVATQNNITVAQLQAVNPPGMCTKLRSSQHVCVLPGRLATSSPFERSCGEAVPTEIGDTCLSISVENNVSTTVLEWLNPHLDCTVPLPLTSVCTAPLLLGQATVSCNVTYTITQADTCFSVASAANLTMANFMDLNPGVRCYWPNWNVGRQVCISGIVTPLSESETLPNLIPYYVHAGDTLQGIAEYYAPQCDNALTVDNTTDIELYKTGICWANGWMPDCSDRRVVVGAMVLVPCVKNIGGSSCGAEEANDNTNLFVCGNNFVTYANYACASTAFASPVSKYEPCAGCELYCMGISGVTLMSYWNLRPNDCPDVSCAYPGFPDAAFASQGCPGTASTLSKQCQVLQLQCVAAVASLSFINGPSGSETSRSTFCLNFRTCMSRFSCRPVARPCGRFYSAICPSW